MKKVCLQRGLAVVLLLALVMPQISDASIKDVFSDIPQKTQLAAVVMVDAVHSGFDVFKREVIPSTARRSSLALASAGSFFSELFNSLIGPYRGQTIVEQPSLTVTPAEREASKKPEPEELKPAVITKYVTITAPPQIIERIVERSSVDEVTSEELNARLASLMGSLREEILSRPVSVGYTVPPDFSRTQSLSELKTLTSTAGTFSTLSVGNSIFVGSGTSTFSGGIETNLLSVISTTASSTFANGINLAAGCFAVNGTCISGDGGGEGTVTSVDVSGGTTGLTFSDGPITTSGTVTMGGILGVTNGGTGWGNLQANTVLLGNGTGNVATTSAGLSGQVLALVSGVPTWVATTTAGTGLAYTGGTFSINSTQNISKLSNLVSNGFVKTSGGDGSLSVDTNTYLTSAVTALGPAGQTQTGATLTIASSTLGTDFSVTGSGDTLTWNLPTASVENRGLLSSADWTTFNSKVSSQWTTSSSDVYFNTGSVGVGTTSPWAKLSINNYSAGASTMPLFTIASSTGSGATTTAFIVNSVGKVGIGTTSPSALLAVDTEDAAQALSFATKYVTVTGDNVMFDAINDGVLRTRLTDDGSQVWYVSDVGRVEITSPSGRPGVTFFNSSGTGRTQIRQADSTGGIGFAASTGGEALVDMMVFSTDGHLGIGDDTPDFTLETIGTLAVSSAAGTDGDLFVVDTSGKVGIGTTTPWAKLSVNNYSAAASTMPLFTIASSTGAGATTTAFIVDSVGNVGIGSSSPTAKFVLAGGTFLQTASGNPTFKGLVSTGSYASAVKVVGRYAYIANFTSGLAIVDVTNPAVPVVVGTYDTADVAYRIAVAGQYAYVADGATGLVIFDISNPFAPALVGSYNTSGSARDVAVAGKYAYIADHSAGLQVIDVSNPTAPVLVGTFNTAGTAYGVTVSGKYAYIADLSSLQIIDISNPRTPMLISASSPLSNAAGVSVIGQYAYVAAGTTGVYIIDISNPRAPTITTTYETPGAVFEVSVAGKYAYVADGTSGLQIVDVSTPATPVLVGTYDTSNVVAASIFISGKYAYVANDSSGLLILDINGTDVPTLAAGAAEIDALSVIGNGTVGDSLTIKNSLTVGSGGLFTTGFGSFAARATTSLSADARGASVPALSASLMDSNSSSVVDVFALTHLASSSAASNIGTGLLFVAEDSSGFATSTSRIASVLTNVTAATPASVLTFSNKNTTGKLTEFMRLDQNGNLGVGTTSPLAKLSVSNWSAGASTMPLFTIASSTGTVATTTVFVVNSVGNVGIGTSSPWTKLSITQSSATALGGLVLSAAAANDRAIYMDASDVLHFVSASGIDSTLTAAGTWTAGSDIGYKHSVQNLAYGLGDIIKLRPVNYLMNGSNIPQIGFIAQDVEQVIPEVVSGEEGHKGIAYGNLTALTVRGLQDLASLLDVQYSTTTKNTLSSVRLDDIESRLKALEEKAQANQITSAISNTLALVTEWAGEKLTATFGTFKYIQTDRIQVEEGITMKDKTTGAYYCVIVDGGVMKNIAGTCESVFTTTTTSSTNPIVTPVSISTTTVSNTDTAQASTTTTTTTSATSTTVSTTTPISTPTPAPAPIVDIQPETQVQAAATSTTPASPQVPVEHPALQQPEQVAPVLETPSTTPVVSED